MNCLYWTNLAFIGTMISTWRYMQIGKIRAVGWDDAMALWFMELLYKRFYILFEKISDSRVWTYWFISSHSLHLKVYTSVVFLKKFALLSSRSLYPVMILDDWIIKKGVYLNIEYCDTMIAWCCYCWFAFWTHDSPYEYFVARFNSFMGEYGQPTLRFTFWKM